MRGYGWKSAVRRGSEPRGDAPGDGRGDGIRPSARSWRSASRPAYGEAVRRHGPMIVARSPRAGAGPQRTAWQKKLEGFWRSHQVPAAAPQLRIPSKFQCSRPGCGATAPHELSMRRHRSPSSRPFRPKGSSGWDRAAHANRRPAAPQAAASPPIEAYAVRETPARGEHENT